MPFCGSRLFHNAIDATDRYPQIRKRSLQGCPVACPDGLAGADYALGHALGSQPERRSPRNITEQLLDVAETACLASQRGRVIRHDLALGSQTLKRAAQQADLATQSLKGGCRIAVGGWR